MGDYSDNAGFAVHVVGGRLAGYAEGPGGPDQDSAFDLEDAADPSESPGTLGLGSVDRRAGPRWARPGTRVPERLHTRAIALFRAPANVSYLRALLGEALAAAPRARAQTLATIHDAVYDWSSGEGRAYDVLASDGHALRARGRALDAWAEVRRLNLAFASERLAEARGVERVLAYGPGAGARDGVDDDDEPYHMRMFTADSLRPPGLEHLNDAGPLYAIREDRAEWAAQRPPPLPWAPPREAPRAPQHTREGFAARGPAGPWPPGTESGGPRGLPLAPLSGSADGVSLFGSPSGAARGDWGAPNRLPEEAVAEYWGSAPPSRTAIGAPERAGRTYGESSSWGAAWAENGGSRFMRYETIPFWQRGGERAYEADIEETLGTYPREMGGHVRRWDMGALREPRGQSYRRLGPRSGPVA